MRRLAIVLSFVLALGVFPTQDAVPASLAGQPPGPTVLQGDFNGDRIADLAVGVPGEDLGAVADAGAVTVVYRGQPSLAGSQVFSQNGAGGSAEAGDAFGDAVAVGNFNGDGFGDLAVGAPGENVGSAGDAGAINVLYGSASGLSGAGSQQFTQNSPGVASSAESGDAFGAALAAGDFNGDGFADLAVGVPLEAGSVRVGAVTVLYGSAGGLTGAGSQMFTQNSPRIPDSSEAGDGFGTSLAAGLYNGVGFAGLAIGVPGEDLGAAVDAGAVTVLRGSDIGLTGDGSALFTQDTPGIGGSAETGDLFGFALAAGTQLDIFTAVPDHAHLAIGAPGEDVFSVVDAGSVTLLLSNVGVLQASGSASYTQNNIGLGPAAEAGDLFGYSLAMGDFTGSGSDEEPIGGPHLAIGVPGEDVFNLVDAGVVDAVYGSFPEQPRQLQFTQPGQGAGAEPGDRFGFALTSTGNSLASVMIGAPGEDVNTSTGLVRDAGAVSFLHGTRDFQGEGGGGLVSSQILLYQNTPGVPGTAEPGDLFGAALATSAL